MPEIPTGRSRGELAAFLDAQRDAALVVERCAYCPDWEAEGPAGEVRRQFERHVAVAHPGHVVRGKAAAAHRLALLRAAAKMGRPVDG